MPRTVIQFLDDSRWLPVEWRGDRWAVDWRGSIGTPSLHVEIRGVAGMLNQVGGASIPVAIICDRSRPIGGRQVPDFSGKKWVQFGETSCCVKDESIRLRILDFAIVRKLVISRGGVPAWGVWYWPDHWRELTGGDVEDVDIAYALRWHLKQ